MHVFDPPFRFEFFIRTLKFNWANLEFSTKKNEVRLNIKPWERHYGLFSKEDLNCL